ncbi:MAG: hypothetical protein ACK4G4_11920 [Thermus sp.]|uniref:hypothetical protein n=1 Tax=Thermus sp. TaxID=275 RepID=UPI00391A27D7
MPKSFRGIPFLFLATALVIASSLAEAVSQKQLGFNLAVFGCLIAWYTILRLEKQNLSSFAVLFSTFFIAYSLAPTLEGAFTGFTDYNMAQGIIGDIILGWDVNFTQIALLTSVALIAFALGLLVYRLQEVKAPLRRIPDGYSGLHLRTWLYWLGLAAFLLGYALALLDLTRVGGLQALFIPRVERLYSLAESRGSLPSSPFVFGGLTVALIGWLGGGKGKGSRNLLLGALVGVWLIYLLIQGDRRYILYTLLVFLGVAYIYRDFALKLNFKTLFWVVALYFVFAFFGATRWALVPLLQGSLSPGEAADWLAENFSLSWFYRFSSGELMGPYFTLIMGIRDQDWQSFVGAPLLGMTYLYGIPNLLPRSLYPGVKWETLSFLFSEYIYNTYLPGSFSVPIGFGFSPLAEACLNFGANLFAPFPFFLLLGWFSGWLAGLARRRPLPWGVAYSLVLPQAFNLNRIDFAWGFQEVVYFVAVGFFIVALARVLGGLRRRGSST